MKTKSSPSRYRYCISRLSTLATSTLVPALKVRSTTLPDSTFFSLVRTNAPPLPGLTCWKSTTFQSWPSMLRVMPFLRSLVVATGRVSCVRGGTGSSRSENEQLPRGRGEYLGCSRPGPGPGGRPLGIPRRGAHHQGVLDPDAAPAGQVDPGFDGNGNPVSQCTGPPVPDDRGLVHLQADAVAEPVPEILVVTGVADQVTGGRVDGGHIGADGRRAHAGPLGGGHQVIDLPLPAGRLAERHGAGHVGVVPAEPRAAVDRDQVPLGERPVAGHVMRDRAVRPAGHDRVERWRLGAEVDHRPFQQNRDLALRAARREARQGGGERLVGDRAGPG